jgi:hypothetical protein
MSQVNVNSPPPGERPVETVDSASTDRTAAAGINLITVLIVLAVLVVIAWYLFTGPLRSFTGGGTTNVNVNNPPQPAPTVNVNPPNPGGNNPSVPNPGNPGTGNNTSPGGGNTGTRP